MTRLGSRVSHTVLKRAINVALSMMIGAVKQRLAAVRVRGFCATVRDFLTPLFLVKLFLRSVDVSVLLVTGGNGSNQISNAQLVVCKRGADHTPRAVIGTEQHTVYQIPYTVPVYRYGT